MFGAIMVFVLPTPDVVLAPLVGCSVVIVLIGLGVLFEVRVAPLSSIWRYMVATSVTLVLLTWLMAWTPGRTIWAAMLLLPLVGGIEARQRGAIVGGAIGLVGILGNAALANWAWQLDVDPAGIAGEVAAHAAMTWFCLIWAVRTEAAREWALQQRVGQQQARERELVASFDEELEHLRTAMDDVTSNPLQVPLRSVEEPSIELTHPALSTAPSREVLADIRRQVGQLTDLVEDLHERAAGDDD